MDRRVHRDGYTMHAYREGIACERVVRHHPVPCSGTFDTCRSRPSVSELSPAINLRGAQSALEDVEIQARQIPIWGIKRLLNAACQFGQPFANARVHTEPAVTRPRQAAKLFDTVCTRDLAIMVLST